MASKWTANLVYLRNRTANAWWMLRRGKFKLIVENLRLETNHVIALYRIKRYEKRKPETELQAESCFERKAKVLPPSYRPSVNGLFRADSLQFDARFLAHQLSDIKSALAISDKKNPKRKWQLFRF